MTDRVVIWLAVSSPNQAAPDKVSLEEQERLGRAWCAAQGAQLVAVLTVPGFSRSETDVITAYEEFAAEGIFVYHDLRRLWQEKAFDVLWVYIHDRIARSSALYAQVMSNVVKSGARIFSHSDGWIDEHNVDAFIAIGGYSASSYIKHMKQRSASGKDKLAERGLPSQRDVLFSHRVVRDTYGRAQRVELDESKARLWADVAALLLENVPWNKMEVELFNRFGHVGANGNMLPKGTIKAALYNPTFWGHSSRRYHTHSRGATLQMAWVYDDTEPVPEGVLVYRNKIAPVYTGELAETIKAELRRREDIARGRGMHRTGKFTGLFICGECGYTLAYDRRQGRVYLLCNAKRVGHYKSRTCSQGKALIERNAQSYLDALLRQTLETGTLQAAMNESAPRVDSAAQQLERLRGEVGEAEDKLRRLILDKAGASQNIAYLYDEQIARLGEQLARLKAEGDRLEYQVQTSVHRAAAERRVLTDIATMTLEAFWQQPDYVINQLLHRLLAGYRFVVLEGEIERLVPKPSRPRGRNGRGVG
jgi:hypothetical protein